MEKTILFIVDLFNIRKLVLVLLVCFSHGANAMPFTFDSDASINGFQGISSINIGGSNFDLFTVTDTDGFYNSGFSLGTVTDPMDQDWFLFQLSVDSNVAFTVTAEILGADAIGVSRLGPGFTPVGGGTSFTPPTWDYNFYSPGVLSDKLFSTYAIGDLLNAGDVLFTITSNGETQRIQTSLVSLHSVPEPAALLLMGIGILALSLSRRYI